MATPAPGLGPATSPTVQPSILIDVLQDLASPSALRKVVGDGGAVFNLLGKLTEYAQLPVGSAAEQKVKGTASIHKPAKWATSNGISFSLTPKAVCTISIDTVSTNFPVAMRIDSTTTTDVMAMGAGTGSVYVNIEMDFDIQGSVSGNGSFQGLGIAGKASGSENATLVFCQPVDAAQLTLDAVKLALSKLVFPLEPSCAESMEPGSLAKVSFDGVFDCELDVTYGLGSHQVSAPSVVQVQKSLHNLVKITAPSFLINGGAKGSVTYHHADHFALIVSKTDAHATVYLVRSDENDWGASVGVTVGVTPSQVAVTLDQPALQAAVQQVTGNATLASSVAEDASQPLNKLETSLNAKLNDWLSDATGQTSLTVSLARQHGHTALFVFDVDLSNADLAKASWSALVNGSVIEALSLRGFTLVAGSGVSDSLKRSAKIQFQFFNLFNFSSTTDYFSKAFTELGSDGTIRVFNDVGQEKKEDTKKALSAFRIHFVAVAVESASGSTAKGNVDLYIELSQKGNDRNALRVANAIGRVPANSVVHAAQSAMATYLANHAKGTLDLVVVLKASAYGKLAATAYNGKKPLPLPHEQDQDNWDAFQSATEALMPEENLFVRQLSFANWIEFNRIANDREGSEMIPDRRQDGNRSNVRNSSFGNYGDQTTVTNFLLASAGFMNLCDDLHALASTTAQANDDDHWDKVLSYLTEIVTKDAFVDFTGPILGGLLAQCSVAGVTATSSVNTAKDLSNLTCTLTLA